VPGLPPIVLAIAHALVTRYRLRIADPRDSRLISLNGPYELVLAGWTGERAALVAFYTPPADPAAAGHDLALRCDAARRWGHERLQQQGARVCDILLVALSPLAGSLSSVATPNDPVRLGVAWVDPQNGNADQVLPVPPGMPGVAELRQHARAIASGATAPTLAAVDLAERQTVAGGYIAPVRRAMVTPPAVTYGLIASFVAVYLLERAVLRTNDPFVESQLELNLGVLANFAPYTGDWWRYVSSAFLHDPNDILHLGFNALAMFWIGRIVEQLYGRIVLAATFFLTAAVGSLLWVLSTAVGLTQPGGVSLGASGGIMGLVGLLLVLGRVQGRNVPAGIAASLRQYAVLVVVINLVFGFLTPTINNYAHIGGLAAGALIGLVIPPLQRVGGRDLKLVERVSLGAVIAVGVIALVIAGVNLIQSGGLNPASAAS